MRNTISRAEYDTAKANCAAKINTQMVKLGLTPAAIQTISSQALLTQHQAAAVSMQDLNSYRQCRSLPKTTKGKLQALAAVLRCHIDDLVPKKLQDERPVVSRRINGVRDQDVFRVIDHPTAGFSMLEVRCVMRTEIAHKLCAGLIRQGNVEYMHRTCPPGTTEQEMEEHRAAARLTQQLAKEEPPLQHS